MVIFSDNSILLIVIVCTSMVFVLSLLLLFIKEYHINQKRKNAKITNSLHACLVNYLLGDNETSANALETIKTNFSGIYADKVFSIYKELELYTISYEKLRRSSWHSKIQGMYELSTLEYDDAYDEISTLLNHKNDNVKRNARVSVVQLRKNKAFLTLKDIEGNMSRWTFINILAILKRTPMKLTKGELAQLQADQNPYMRELASELVKVNYVQ